MHWLCKHNKNLLSLILLKRTILYVKTPSGRVAVHFEGSRCLKSASISGCTREYLKSDHGWKECYSDWIWRTERMCGSVLGGVNKQTGMNVQPHINFPSCHGAHICCHFSRMKMETASGRSVTSLWPRRRSLPPPCSCHSYTPRKVLVLSKVAYWADCLPCDKHLSGIKSIPNCCIIYEAT